MPAGLSHTQKRDIAMAARRAYLAWPGREAYEGANPEVSRSDCFQIWKHQEQAKALQPGVAHPVGRSTCDMTQAHFNRVLAHFEELGGNAAGAQRRRDRDQDNDRRVARWKLTQALRERGLDEAYAASICRAKYKCGLDEASEGQLWKVFYDVRTRRKPLAQPAQQNREPDPF